MCLGTGLVLAACQSREVSPTLFWRVPPDQKASFTRAQNACHVEVAKVQAPYLAVDDPIQADVVGRQVYVACLRGKGFVLSRVENG